jgi:hypothetical protein
MAYRDPPAPSQMAPNVGLFISVSGRTSVVSSIVPVEQLVDLSDAVGPPSMLTPRNESHVLSPPSRRLSYATYDRPSTGAMSETQRRSLNPFHDLAPEQVWPHADSLLRPFQRQAPCGGDRRAHVSFDPRSSDFNESYNGPCDRVASTPFGQQRQPGIIVQRASKNLNPFLPNAVTEVEPLRSLQPEAEVEIPETVNRVDPIDTLLPPISERKTAIKVEKYDGSSCIETYLLKFEHIARYNKWRD